MSGRLKLRQLEQPTARKRKMGSKIEERERVRRERSGRIPPSIANSASQLACFSPNQPNQTQKRRREKMEKEGRRVLT